MKLPNYVPVLRTNLWVKYNVQKSYKFLTLECQIGIVACSVAISLYQLEVLRGQVLFVAIVNVHIK